MTDNPFAYSNNAVNETIQVLRAAGVRSVHKKTCFQIKVGPFNFYPVKGTIFHDGEHKARPERGLEAFINLLEMEGMAVSPAPATPGARLVVPNDDS